MSTPALIAVAAAQELLRDQPNALDELIVNGLRHLADDADDMLDGAHLAAGIRALADDLDLLITARKDSA